MLNNDVRLHRVAVGFTAQSKTDIFKMLLIVVVILALGRKIFPSK